MKFFTYSILLLVLALVCAYSFRLVRVVENPLSVLPGEIRDMRSFNDAPAFTRTGDDGRTFICSRILPDMYARFKIPYSDQLSDISLDFTIKCDRDVAKSIFPRGAKGLPGIARKESNDGRHVSFYFGKVAEFEDRWKDGNVYIGIGFAPGSIRTNDVIELVDFHFRPNGL